MILQNEFLLKGNNQTDVLTPVSLFEKRTVTELSDADMADVNGGSSPTILASISAVAATVKIAQAGYEFGKWLAS